MPSETPNERADRDRVAQETHADDRTPFSKASASTTAVVAASIAMAAPGALGYAVDVWLGTRFVFLIVGVVLGTVYGMWRLIQFSKQMNRP